MLMLKKNPNEFFNFFIEFECIGNKSLLSLTLKKFIAKFAFSVIALDSHEKYQLQ